MDSNIAQYWIDRLQLTPHPEGGFYREVYRSDSAVARAEGPGNRSACTSIYYLLEDADYSGFHRLASDEIWYYHSGEPLHIHLIAANGHIQTQELSFSPSGMLSLAIAANTWFAAEIPGKTGYALCSCAVAPGFEFAEFEMGNKEDLLTAFPVAATLIEKLSR